MQGTNVRTETLLDVYAELNLNIKMQKSQM